jgi:hypothetical protein
MKSMKTLAIALAVVGVIGTHAEDLNKILAKPTMGVMTGHNLDGAFSARQESDFSALTVWGVFSHCSS